MKVSILTPTYNRVNDLERLYTSLVVNSNCDIKFEWLIMDDGSTDRTRLAVDNFIKQGIVDIKYYYQKNSGKMSAINNLMKHVRGDLVMTCDSDDYLVTGALDKIKKHADRVLKDETVYALAFLKETTKGKISGNRFPEDIYRSDMFGLYFREKITGEKILVFKTKIRKQFSHQLEEGETFVTEARMYHKMDLNYDLICINDTLEVGDYRDDGYTKNINKIFKENPLGYYMYFKEILDMNLQGVGIAKRMYVYKHYILFANLAHINHPIIDAGGILNKIIIMALWIPGKIATKKKYQLDNKDDKDKENNDKKNKNESLED